MRAEQAKNKANPISEEDLAVEKLCAWIDRWWLMANAGRTLSTMLWQSSRAPSGSTESIRPDDRRLNAWIRVANALSAAEMHAEELISAAYLQYSQTVLATKGQPELIANGVLAPPAEILAIFSEAESARGLQQVTRFLSHCVAQIVPASYMQPWKQSFQFRRSDREIDGISAFELQVTGETNPLCVSPWSFRLKVVAANRTFRARFNQALIAVPLEDAEDSEDPTPPIWRPPDDFDLHIEFTNPNAAGHVMTFTFPWQAQENNVTTKNAAPDGRDHVSAAKPTLLDS
jgi:hypothetical protein